MKMTGSVSRIGIFGGTFDPMHLGHLRLAEHACERMGLEKMLIMPTPAPYHRTDKKVSGLEHRINMVKLTIADSKWLEFSDFEINLPGPTYTANTLKEFQNAWPDTEIYLVVGGDSLFSMQYWYQPEEIFSRAVILSSIRTGECGGASGICKAEPGNWQEAAAVGLAESITGADQKSELTASGAEGQLRSKEHLLKTKWQAQADRLRNLYGARICDIEMPLTDISSSDIVRRVREGLSIEGLVKDSVAEYIFRNGLYR